MKLISFKVGTDADPRVGALVGDVALVDLTQMPDAPFNANCMQSLIESGPAAIEWIRRRMDEVVETLPLADVRLLAPIPRLRRNVFCVGWNYLEHFNEGEKTRSVALEIPKHPTFFSKATNALNGPYEPIQLDGSITEKLDWEAELGVVIGRGGRDIKEPDAMGHVFGYVVINDVTGRDIQRQHGGQWFKGKSLDGSCPMGPFITTVDEIDPGNLRLYCGVNGVTKQDSNTQFMYFKIPQLIAELSHGLTLEPGDIIATGTPQGVGHTRNPPEFLRCGDVLETEVMGLGKLRNVVMEAVTTYVDK